MSSLQMIYPSLESLPTLAEALDRLPPGYAFRTFRPGDEAAWAAIMNTGEMNEWDETRTRERLTGVAWPQFDPQGLYFVTHGPQETPVGSACAWLIDPAQSEMGVLHMVCVLPEHRGAGLAIPLCLAVLHRFRERGFKQVMLNTGDWRLGAVKTYLKLGFHPYITKPEQPEVWETVLQTLNWTGPITYIPKETD